MTLRIVSQAIHGAKCLRLHLRLTVLQEEIDECFDAAFGYDVAPTASVRYTPERTCSLLCERGGLRPQPPSQLYQLLNSLLSRPLDIGLPYPAH